MEIWVNFLITENRAHSCNNKRYRVKLRSIYDQNTRWSAGRNSVIEFSARKTVPPEQFGNRYGVKYCVLKCRSLRELRHAFSFMTSIFPTDFFHPLRYSRNRLANHVLAKQRPIIAALPRSLYFTTRSTEITPRVGVGGPVQYPRREKKSPGRSLV